MSIYSLDWNKWIAELLPLGKRQPVRIAWLFRLFAWKRKINDEFTALEVNLSEQAKITSHVIVVEDYLRQVFGLGINIVVHVIQNEEDFIADDSDESFGFSIVADEELTGGSFIAADADPNDFANFTVQVPISLGVDMDRLKAIIDKYKTTGSTYIIEET